MKRNDDFIQEKVKKVFTADVPDVYASVLSDVKNQKGQVRTMKRKSTSRKTGLIAAMAVCLVAVFALVLGITMFGGESKASAIVSLDVNPSIQIEVDENGKVIKVQAMNDDAAEIIGTMDLSGSTLEVAVNAIVGAMVRAGKLSEIQNSILLSVNAKNAELEKQISDRLTAEVNKAMQESGLGAAILSQSVADDKELAALAEKYGITEGKAQLIKKILGLAPQYTFESLVGLTVNELNVIINSKVSVPDGVTSTGTASTGAYITAEEAKRKALEFAGKTEDEVFDLEVEFDADDGIIVYEVEFDADGKEYEYEINAKTGEKVKEKIKVKQSSPVVTPDNLISRDEAKRIALAKVGLTEEQVTFTKIKLDADDDEAEYEIKFFTATEKFEIEIDAKTGDVLKVERKVVQTPQEEQGDHITANRAQEIAIEHAKLTASEVVMEKIELDYDDGIYVYEVEFVSGGYEYEYKIDAKTGEILESEKEPIED